MVRKTHPTEKFMPANNDEPQLAYTVQEHNTRFEVCTASGRTVLVFADVGSTSHYAALLNEPGRVHSMHQNNIDQWLNMMVGLIGSGMVKY